MDASITHVSKTLEPSATMDRSNTHTHESHGINYEETYGCACAHRNHPTEDHPTQLQRRRRFAPRQWYQALRAQPNTRQRRNRRRNRHRRRERRGRRRAVEAGNALRCESKEDTHSRVQQIGGLAPCVLLSGIHRYGRQCVHPAVPAYHLKSLVVHSWRTINGAEKSGRKEKGRRNLY